MKKDADTLQGRQYTDSTATPYSIVSTGSTGLIADALMNASATPGANKIVKAGSDGKISITSAWFKYYDSGVQTITAAGALTLAHGLGTTPVFVQAWLKCTSADMNYSVNDMVLITGAQDSSSTSDNYGVSIVPDATNLNIRFGTTPTVFKLNNKTTGAGGNITLANWKIVFRALA